MSERPGPMRTGEIADALDVDESSVGVINADGPEGDSYRVHVEEGSRISFGALRGAGFVVAGISNERPGGVRLIVLDPT